MLSRSSSITSVKEKYESVVAAYEEKMAALTINLDSFKKESTLEQNRRRIVESQLTDTREEVGAHVKK